MGSTLSVIASGDATSPEGRGSGEDGRYRPHQLTGIKQKLHALAKGSPLGRAGERSEPERVRTPLSPYDCLLPTP